ncbi:MAG: chemotaxis protein CheA [Ruminococcus sp.]|jgi:two-component system chemotaxis sensor kinase CheA|nr:chemotaxis protein CheA [Ruminococcus sp.]
MGRFESGMESMIDVYIYETTTLLEQLDQILIKTESNNSFGEEEINEIFRTMHTIKGSSAMMGLDNMQQLAHHIEDLFFIIRDDPDIKIADRQIKQLYDIVFTASDLLKAEVESLSDEDSAPTDFDKEIQIITNFVNELKKVEAESSAAAEAESVSQEAVGAEGSAAETGDGAKTVSVFSVRVFFEEGCEMENLRALLVVNQIKDDCKMLEYEPSNIESDSSTVDIIRDSCFVIHFLPKDDTNENAVYNTIGNAMNVSSYEVLEGSGISLGAAAEMKPSESAFTPQTNVQTDFGNKINLQSESPARKSEPRAASAVKSPVKNESDIKEEINKKVGGENKGKQSLISVNLTKLDQLLDMVGEIVIAEAMVTANQDIKHLKLDNFQKAARQLRKLTDELQDIVMSIRMVPLSGVFNKMTRIVRDMKVKLGKDVNLVLEGEDTEVDKSIIDSLNDPIMHMVRNSMDHGIEDNVEDRLRAGKPAKGTITLAAYNSSGEVIIVVSDDGGGINAEKVLQKAAMQGILTKPESEYTEKEIFNLVMLPGFSTNEEVTEYSGRGVGMDVVRKSIEKIGGTVSVDSKEGMGTNFVIKIPLSLAIVDGIEISVGDSIFTIPINSIKEFIKLEPKQVFFDTSGKEMVKIRNQVFSLLRLHEYYGIEPKSYEPTDGVVIVVESEGKSTCILADELIGEQQVVVKPFSAMLNRYNVKQNGMAGCTILGDGSITIILDISYIIRDF